MTWWKRKLFRTILFVGFDEEVKEVAAESENEECGKEEKEELHYILASLY